MSPTTRPQTNPARSSRRFIGAALGLVLVVGAAPFLRSATAAQPTGDAPAAAETAIVAGAEAGDPAIWVNPQDATKSLILGANNTRLVTYDMTGAVVAQAGVPAGTTAGDVTGVDVRDAVSVGSSLIGDVATAVGNGIIRFYAINPGTSLLTDVGGRTLAPAEWHSGKPSKVCMYQSPVSNKTYAFMMSDNGEMAQYELIDNAGKIDIQMVRGGTSALTVWDIAETGTVAGCVADDENKALYVSETTKGILRIGAEPTDPTDEIVIDTPAPGHLLASVKGLAIVKTGDTAGYLMAATVAPGATVTESFNVYDRAAGNAYIRTFNVPAGATADKCDLTEGIDAAAGNFGPGFTSGLFVCQDKRNRPAMGGGTEANNYKMVRLEQIVDMTSAAVPTTTTLPQVTPTTAPTQVPMPNRTGYWMVGADGRVYNFGDAKSFGDAGLPAGALAVDLEPTPSGDGYWIIDDRGTVYAKGDAKALGNVDRAMLNSAAAEVVTSLSATKTGNGYWIFTSLGRVIPFGDAAFYGDMRDTKLNGAVLDSIATASGKGYFMVGSDGGIFSFGDAVFKGSMGGKPLNKPVQSLVPDGDGDGYWLVASDGGIFAFEALFKGSMGAVKLNRPVTGMVRYGDGYLMVGEDGGIFSFSSKKFVGSLGDNPPAKPITSVAVLDTPAAAQ